MFWKRWTDNIQLRTLPKFVTTFCNTVLMSPSLLISFVVLLKKLRMSSKVLSIWLISINSESSISTSFISDQVHLLPVWSKFLHKLSRPDPQNLPNFSNLMISMVTWWVEKNEYGSTRHKHSKESITLSVTLRITLKSSFPMNKNSKSIFSFIIFFHFVLIGS